MMSDVIKKLHNGVNYAQNEPLASPTNPPDAVSCPSSDIVECEGRKQDYSGKEVYLDVSKEVFFRGHYATQIPLCENELLIGRRDVMVGHYPDVDLAMYWDEDRSLSRRHLRIYCDMNGAFFAEDLCGNTFINGRLLNKNRVELALGDCIGVSKSVQMVFSVRE